jgi:hypothetical protein
VGTKGVTGGVGSGTYGGTKFVTEGRGHGETGGAGKGQYARGGPALMFGRGSGRHPQRWRSGLPNLGGQGWYRTESGRDGAKTVVAMAVVVEDIVNHAAVFNCLVKWVKSGPRGRIANGLEDITQASLDNSGGLGH